MSVITDFINLKVIINGQEKGKTMAAMNSELRGLKKELSGIATNTDEWYKKMAEVQKAEKALQRIKNEVRGLGGIFSRVKDEVKQMGVLLLAFEAFKMASAAIKNFLNSNAKLSDSLADIRKTTGMTTAEVTDLNKSLSKINTRTATAELRNIAIVAGQLGIAKAQVLGFVQATDKLVVALGDEFQGGAEEITKQLGGLRNIFSDIKSDNVGEDMLHIGNALNELGAAGSATAPIVSDFANRIGGVGIPLGLTSAQVLALSATMQELNINAERGGTATTKILQRMANNTAEFAKVAGMPVKEFTELVNTDLYGAFLKVVEGSSKSGQSATALSGILDKLGVDGSGASEVFLKLGKNTDLLQSKLSLSNKALKSTTSITEEFKIKNETLAGNLAKIGKAMVGAFVNSRVMNGIQSMVGWVAKWIEQPFEEKIKEERHELGMLHVKLMDTNMSHEERVKLIDKLKSQYPEYLKNIDSETVGNEELNAALDKVNNSLVAKLILQREQVKIDEQAEKTADAVTERLEAESRAHEEIKNAHEKFGYQLKTNVTWQEQSAAASEYMGKFLKDNNELWKTSLKRMQDAQLVQNGLNWSVDRFNFTKQQENKETDVYNSLLQKQIDLKKQLGIVDESAPVGKYYGPPIPGQEPKKDSPPAAIDEEAQKKAVENLKRLQEEIKKIQHEQELDLLSRKEREIQLVKDKYDKLRDQAKGHAKEIAQINELQENELTAIRDKHAQEREAKYLKELEAERAADEARALARRQFREQVNVALMSDNEREIYQENLKWDKILRTALAYGLDTTKLAAAQSAAIIAIKKKQAAEEVKIASEKRKDVTAQELKQAQDAIQIQKNVVDIFGSLGELFMNNAADQAEFQKVITAFQIGLDVAMSISNAIAAASGQPFPANLIAITSSIATVLGAFAKVNKLFSATGDAPRAERGTVLNGPSHANNGINLYDERGNAVVNAEDGEPVFVMSKKGYRNNKGIVDALMHNSMHGNGDPIDLAPFSYQAKGVNFSSARQAVRFESNNTGADMSFSNGSAAAGNSSGAANDMMILHNVNATLKMLNKRLSQPIHAKLNYDSYTRDLGSIDQAKASGQIGRG